MREPRLVNRDYFKAERDGSVAMWRGRECFVRMPSCPSCGSQLDCDDETWSYCPNCGQPIYWNRRDKRHERQG